MLLGLQGAVSWSWLSCLNLVVLEQYSGEAATKVGSVSLQAEWRASGHQQQKPWWQSPSRAPWGSLAVLARAPENVIQREVQLAAAQGAEDCLTSSSTPPQGLSPPAHPAQESALLRCGATEVRPHLPHLRPVGPKRQLSLTVGSKNPETNQHEIIS